MSESARGPVRFAAAATGVLAVVVLLTVLLDAESHRSGSNNRGLGAAVQLAPKTGRLCQHEEPVPPRAGGIGVYANSLGQVSGPLEVTVLDRGRTVARGEVSTRLFGTPRTDARFDKPIGPAQGLTLCIANRGPAEVRLYGDPSSENDKARVTGMPQFAPARLKIDWLTGREQTALAFSGTVAERFALVKASFFGSWTMWAAFAVLLASCALAVAAVLRAVRE
jgi:hypothetical protein